ncbi:hypothetical protein MTR67_027641 [Solanum verrucosum]|uniref:Uncharacterized protein n=1 Tax=Solanum verrucosum TaxID=315347 RepID=A0AAF0R9J3_SOLVR|nr:hypothetical protein MTR67_027641 [Solanum verrucosum]
MKIVLLFYCFLLLRDLVISFSTCFEMFFLVSRVYRKQPLCLGGKVCIHSTLFGNNFWDYTGLAIMTVTKSMKVIGGYYMVMIVDGDDYNWWLVVMTVGCGTHSKKATTSLEKLTKEANKAEQTTKALDFVPSDIVVPLSNEQLVGEKETHESSGEQSGKEEKKW